MVIKDDMLIIMWRKFDELMSTDGPMICVQKIVGLYFIIDQEVEIWSGVKDPKQSDWLTTLRNGATQGCTNRCSLAAGLRGNEERMRKWRGNGERMRKWRGNGERMRKWRERFTLKISSFSVYFLPLYPFPISKIVTFCRKMLNTALLSRMSQKT